MYVDEWSSVTIWLARSNGADEAASARTLCSSFLALVPIEPGATCRYRSLTSCGYAVPATRRSACVSCPGVLTGGRVTAVAVYDPEAPTLSSSAKYPVRPT